ncbi:MAG: DUF2796 domain-containing protein [Betaproteobacteria bacterium]|nr:DUF2796 domain-containing protein [Betaproteobacteria bacterium]
MKKLFLALAFFLIAAPVIAHKAHTHGAARLNLSVEGDTVEIGFETPLANLISFERAPGNDKESEEARNMAAVLRNPATIFIFPRNAQCSLKTMLLKADVLARELDSTPYEHEHGHEQENHDNADGHADLDAEFVFTCQNPAALNQVEVRLFQAFSALKRIDANLVTPRGQKAMRLTPRSNRLQW